MNLEEAFGLTLKKYRNMGCLSQEELAHQSNLDRTYISLLERGLRRPTLTTIFIIAKCLKKRPSELIQEVENQLNEHYTN
ncbi:helix-turn-helix domain-containing protein [Paenibacillus sp. UNC499MF]|uniref:helix-turn-helix domain-containing protein n=1 Tax=Paenibacillus sp. UNC499MF TaxID=1502751 RepID=UPI000CDE5A2C|nr:helix-turn-helix transcriptional regulator [Paenibacillus sp. UNC499MF]